MRWPYRVFGTLFTIFALIALVLSAIGIYAVMAYSVAQRRQEIGIRMALGATARNLILGVLRVAAIQLAIGISLGLAGAWGVSRVLATILVRSTGTDPVVVATIIVLLTAVTLVACIVPARRAARVDPLTALRSN